MKIKLLASAFVFGGTLSAVSQTVSNQQDYTGNSPTVTTPATKTKPELLASVPNNNSTDMSDPLVIVDGKSCGRISLGKLDNLTINGKKFNLDDIEAIDILKSQAAKNIYGDKGRNGVILITTKKPEKE